MYKYYPVNGTMRVVSNDEAQKLMDELSDQWEDESVDNGVLLTGVYNWDFTSSPDGIQINIPKLLGGGEIPLNKQATEEFGTKIYGDCFWRDK